MRRAIACAAIAMFAAVGVGGAASADPDEVGPGGSTPGSNCAAGDGQGQVLWGALAPLYVYNNGRGTEVCVQDAARVFLDSDEALGLIIWDGPDNIGLEISAVGMGTGNIELPF
jgi:hypothetical protein